MKRNVNVILFYGIMLLAIILTIVWAISFEGHPLANIVFANEKSTFMDYYHSLFHTFESRPYDNNCIYPPFTYLIYSFFRDMIPIEIVEKGGYAIRSSQMGRMTFIFYFVSTLLIMAYQLYRRKKGAEWERLLFVGVMMFSTPFIFAFERGNIIIVSFILLLFFVFNYNHKNSIIRELSYISLAMAVGIKIYPAIFGLLLLREKKYKESFRTICYGIIVFFTPFLFFGGFEKIKIYFNNLVLTVDEFAQRGLGFKVNITNTLKAFNEYLGVNGEFIESLIKIAPLSLLIVSLIAAFLVKEKWKSVGILSATLAIIPGFSFVYTLIFLAIPLIMFLNKVKKERIDIIYTLCFAAMFAPCVFSLGQVFPMGGLVPYSYTLGTFIESIGLLIFIITLSFDGIIEFVLLNCGFTNKKTING